MQKDRNQEWLDALVAGIVGRKQCHGAVFQIYDPQHEEVYTSAAGNLQRDSRYYVASINKMMLATLAMQAAEKDASFLLRPVSAFDGLLPHGLNNAFAAKLAALTPQLLMTHQSGLPCYLLDAAGDQVPFMKQLLRGADRSWTLADVLETVQKLPLKFEPGRPGKAYYSNTNFRLLAAILEQVSGRSVSQLLASLFHDAGMRHTVVLSGADGEDLLPVQAGREVILPTQYFASTGYEVFSTAQDQVRFLNAFFAGKFFPAEKLTGLFHWNRIFFPLQYGAGLQRFHIPRLLSPFKRFPEMIGHSGSVGSVAFYIPEKQIFITGTINHAGRAQSAFRIMSRIANRF